MAKYKGTLAGTRGGTVYIYKDESTSLFKSLRLVKTEKIAYSGDYDFSLPGGDYVFIVRTIGKHFPEIRVTAASGSTVATIPDDAAVPSDRPTAPSTTVPGAPTPGGGTGPVIGDGTKMRATQVSPGVWEFAVDSSTTPGQTTPTTVTIPTSKAPAMKDGEGTANDFVTLYAVDGVKWRVAAPPSTPGTEYSKSWFGGAGSKDAPVTNGGYVEVSAIPETGYTVSGRSAWSFTFTNKTTKAVSIPNAAIPTAQDKPDMANDTVTLTKVDGVTWTVDGVDHPSSAFTGSTKVVPYTKGVNTTVTAKGADADTSIQGQSSWTLVFTNTPAPPTGGTGDGYTQLLALDFNQPDTGILAADKRLPSDTPPLLKIPAGSQISGNRLILPTGKDLQVWTNPGTVVTNKLRVSFRLLAKVDAHGRLFFFFQGTTGMQDLGFVFNGDYSMVYCESGIGAYNQLTAQAGAPSTTWSAGDLITVELDAPAKTVKTFVNGAPAQTYTIKIATNKVSADYRPAFSQMGVALAPAIIDDFKIETA